MTIRGVLKLLIRIDNGYKLTKKEYVELQHIKSLKLEQCTNHKVPTSIKYLKNLKELDLTGTEVEDISPLSKLTKIETLDLSLNYSLKDIRPLSELTSLKTLFLSFTSVSDISSLSRLKNLKYLDLSNTRYIKDIAPLSELKELEFLSLRNSILPSIPESLLTLPLPIIPDLWLPENYYPDYGIFIHGLKLTKQPISLFDSSRDLIKDYYRQPHIRINETKLIFVGSEGVGKTHTIKRILNNNNKISRRLKETPGIDISSKEFVSNELTYTINFWDFGGQTIMHSMHRLFLTERTGYVVVVSTRYGDVTAQAKMWLRNLKSFAGETPVILFVNVWNNGTYYEIDEYSLRNEFENIIEVIHCSAKDSEKDEFATITYAIMKLAETNDSIGMEFPKTWEKIRQELIVSCQSNYHTDSEQYTAICCKNGLQDKLIQGWLLDWFNDLGECLTYSSGQDMISKNHYSMILNPKWLTNAVYLIIRELHDKTDNGIIEHKVIKKLLHNSKKGTMHNISYSYDECDYILSVMRSRQLSYKIPEKEEEFIPALLHNCVVKYTIPKGNESMNYEILYEYLPENVIQRMMVDMYKLIDSGRCWRNKFVLSINGYKGIELSAVISADYDRNVISIQIERYSEREIWETLQALREIILNISKNLNLKTNDFIVLNSKNEFHEVERVSLKRLLKLNKRGVKKYEAYERTYDTKKLLDAAYGKKGAHKINEKIKLEEHNIDIIINTLGRDRAKNLFYDMVAKSIGDDTNYKQLLILPFDN